MRIGDTLCVVQFHAAFRFVAAVRFFRAAGEFIGHRLPPLSVEQNTALATTPVDELLALPMLQPDRVTDPLNAYQLSKRCNSCSRAARRPAPWYVVILAQPSTRHV